MKSTIKFYFIF